MTLRDEEGRVIHQIFHPLSIWWNAPSTQLPRLVWPSLCSGMIFHPSLWHCLRCCFSSKPSIGWLTTEWTTWSAHLSSPSSSTPECLVRAHGNEGTMLNECWCGCFMLCGGVGASIYDKVLFVVKVVVMLIHIIGSFESSVDNVTELTQLFGE